MVAWADAIRNSKGSYLSAIDDNVATDTIVARLVGISATDGGATGFCEIAHRKDGTAIDCDAAARDVVLAAADGSAFQAKSIDAATVDDERSHLNGTDARIVTVV